MVDSSIELPCVDKLSFDSLNDAQSSAVVADWRHGTKLKAYRCQHCGLWHLSSIV